MPANLSCPVIDHTCHLRVDVAERSSEGVAGVLDGGRGHTNVSEINRVGEHRITAWGGVVDGDCTGERILPVGNVLVLPCPPGAVDHAVVQEECWVW